MMTLEDCRGFYAAELRFAANLHSRALIDAFARVPREKYLGPAPWQIGIADLAALSLYPMAGTGSLTYISSEDPRDLYHNVLVALDAAHELNNGHPSTLARWIEALDLKPGERVYHLGCGVGYYTAILAELVGPGGSVVGSEVHLELAARARQNLSGYPQASVHAGDGVAFDSGPCDAMLINAGVTHPQPLWLERLCEEGRLLLPLTKAVAANIGMGVMAKITRHGGAFRVEIVSGVGIYSCTSGRDPQLEPSLGKSLADRSLMKLKSIRLDAHDPGESCAVHGLTICLSTAEVTTPSAT